jgi:outer membrane protein OmpA-like peptidoglycan-associated protein
MDIYVAKKTTSGDYGTVQNISEINTELNEDTPFITADGNKLYFSSQGYVNMGGYDIFVSTLGSDGKWSLPENMGYPVSTTDDDLFYFPWHNGEYGYMSKIIDGGKGAMDIYKVLFGPETEESFAVAGPAEKEAPAETPSPDTTKISPNEEIPVVAMVTDTSKTPERKTTNQVEEKETPGKIELKSVEISPVLFEFDKSQLSEKGRQELDEIVVLLKENSNLKIELTGFADALGPEAYNLALSEKRAMSALNYLVTNGIATSRLKAKGLGETNFIAQNTHPDGSDNPEGRKFNRRVEFVILGTDNNVLIIRYINPVPDALKYH